MLSVSRLLNGTIALGPIFDLAEREAVEEISDRAEACRACGSVVEALTCCW